VHRHASVDDGFSVARAGDEHPAAIVVDPRVDHQLVDVDHVHETSDAVGDEAYCEELTAVPHGDWHGHHSVARYVRLFERDEACRRIAQPDVEPRLDAAAEESVAQRVGDRFSRSS
jgi:hypothetical protein